MPAGRREPTRLNTEPASSRAESIAARALDRPEAERAGFVSDACGDNPELLSHVQKFLASGVLARTIPQERASSGSGDSAPPASALERGAVLGRYVVLEWLGGGGMGVVYAAYDPELGRKVAIKLVKPDVGFLGEETAGRARLIREAQAIARIRHRAVIAVHDVGTIGSEVFVAMEYIAGRTLQAWRAEKPRTWREVLALYIETGSGLVAVHEAGLVHRDFKPENVLVGEDEQPRVLDFGLARLDAVAEVEKESASGKPIGHALSVSVTATGNFLGTPGYMAPEQFEFATVDARADQFSFCVALYEALYGERPFAGTTVLELMVSVRAGTVKDAPRGSLVPPWLRAVLLRGLRTDPAERYPSLGALLADLGRDRTRGRRRWLAVAGGALAIGAVVASVVWTRREARTVCTGAEVKLAGVWDVARRRAVESAFRATDKSYVSGTQAGVERVLDGYAASWVAAQEDACRAARVRGEQSEELLNLRTECLDARREELRALVDVLARPDDRTVLRSVEAVSKLADLRECANASALKARVRPPHDPAARARVNAAEKRVAEARALSEAGNQADALPIAEGTVAEAKEIAYAPLQAEASYVLGLVQHRLGKPSLAEEPLRQAIYAAERSDDVEITARAWLELARDVGQDLGREGEGHDCEQHAMAAIAKWGKGSEEEQADLLLTQGEDLIDHGEFEKARVLLESAVPLAETSLGPESRAVSSILLAIGTALARLGRYDDAMPRLERAQAIREKLFGPDHPAVAEVIKQISTIYAFQNQPSKCVVYDQRVVNIDEAALGPDHPDLGRALFNLCATRMQLEDTARALPECQRALAIDEAALGPNHRRLTLPLLGIGQAYVKLGRPKEAVAPLERALAIREVTGGDPLDTAGVRFTIARALRSSGGDEKHAVELAKMAREAFAANGEPSRSDLQRVDEWLAKKR